MKKFITLTLTLISLLILTVIGVSAEEACGEPTIVTLYAGQHIDAGTVTVSNDSENLYISFEASGDWLLATTHAHVAESLEDIPQNGGGNPKIGNFDYKTDHDPAVDSYTYTIPLDSNWTDLVIAAHAAMIRVDGDGNIVQEETGWGNGDDFPGRSWAMYFSYTVQPCEEEDDDAGYQEVGTAFAYGDGFATCFDNDGFSRWGWTNGPISPDGTTHSWAIYAGAGQCDLSKGTHVGYLTVTYSNGMVSVVYSAIEDYAFSETHLYVGSDPYPDDQNGNDTVAPGQYGNINEYYNIETGSGTPTTSDSFVITGLSGDIYIIAHAVAVEPAD